MEATAHPRQNERLRELHNYEVLDTPREKDFDDIVWLASQICGAPISVVNLVDAERQWFKAEVGLGVRETPIETSICAHAILEDDFVEIGDTRQDLRMQDNPLCAGPDGLRFYAGALLKGENGLPLGTLCVLDTKPRALTEFQRDAMKVLANQVMRQLDLRRALSNEKTLRREVDHRVKNSLQVVASHTRLQRRRAENPETIEALEIVQRRIETTAAIHAQLYRPDAGANIDLADFLNTLADLLREVRPNNVEISVSAEPVTVEPSEAAMVAAIINEFATNSFKHGFPDGRGGTVTISAGFDAGDYVIVMSDDGKGQQGDVSEGAGLGLKIIRASCTQLEGSAEIDAGTGGYRITARLPFGRPRTSGTLA